MGSDSIVYKNNFQEPDKILINDLMYINLVKLVECMRKFSSRCGDINQINRNRFIQAYENQVYPLIEAGCLEIYFTNLSYKESLKEMDLVSRCFSYEEDKILWKEKDDNNRSSIGIFIDSKGNLQVNLSDLKYSLCLDFVNESDLNVSKYQCHFHSVANSRREKFIDKENLFKFFLQEGMQSELKNLKDWLDRVFLHLDSKETEEVVINFSRGDLEKINKILKESSIEDLVIKVVRNYLAKSA